ncbi:MAG TPA: metallophosphoesterase family protein [Burkholderiaceae bacterium]|nr:metallophosphoesterase family protein [Burkholderiaceae bacterium]
MKIAAISDIHGNLPALDAVLADIAAQRADIVVNLGDILSGPLWGAATAERLMPLRLPTIAGNHERQLLTLPRDRMSASDAHTADELQPAHRDWIASLPATRSLSDEVYCCHGTPTSDLVYFLETTMPGFAGVGRGANGVRAATLAEATERAGAVQQGIANAVILCGHTHMPRVLRLADGRLIVNPGSVGLQGYDDDHGHPHVIETRAPHARYTLLERGAAGWSVALRAVAYDWESSARRAEREGRPDWAHTLRTGFVGPLEAEVA